MIDLHLHLLPAVDDGAKSLDVSRAMLERARQLGFTRLVATPHLKQFDSDYLDRVAAAYADILPLAEEAGVAVQRGFEVLLTPSTPRDLERDGALMTLAGSRSVLVETSLAGWPTFADQVLFEIQSLGYTPLLAHPERYHDIIERPERAMALADRGVLLQATTSVYAGLFGKTVQRVAEDLLEAGAIHILATDAHSLGQRVELIQRGLDRVASLVGPERARQLTTDNPAALLAGEPLPEPAPVTGAKRRWSLHFISH